MALSRVTADRRRTVELRHWLAEQGAGRGWHWRVAAVFGHWSGGWQGFVATVSSRTMWGTLRARVHSGYVWGYDVALQVSVPPEVRNSPKQITASPPIQQHYCTSPPYSGIAANLPYDITANFPHNITASARI